MRLFYITVLCFHFSNTPASDNQDLYKCLMEHTCKAFYCSKAGLGKLLLKNTGVCLVTLYCSYILMPVFLTTQKHFVRGCNKNLPLWSLALTKESLKDHSSALKPHHKQHAVLQYGFALQLCAASTLFYFRPELQKSPGLYLSAPFNDVLPLKMGGSGSKAKGVWPFSGSGASGDSPGEVSEQALARLRASKNATPFVFTRRR